MAKTVNVECRLSNGLQTCLFEWADGPVGIRTAVRKPGSSRSFEHGFNPGVDAAWWDEWLKQNEGSVYADEKWMSATPEKEK